MPAAVKKREGGRGEGLVGEKVRTEVEIGLVCACLYHRFLPIFLELRRFSCTSKFRPEKKSRFCTLIFGPLFPTHPPPSLKATLSSSCSRLL